MTRKFFSAWIRALNELLDGIKWLKISQFHYRWLSDKMLYVRLISYSKVSYIQSYGKLYPKFINLLLIKLIRLYNLI